MPSPVSCYILTFNSERYIRSVIRPIAEVTDELVIVDSGSTDRTEEIVREFRVKFISRSWTNFRDQRIFALGGDITQRGRTELSLQQFTKRGISITCAYVLLLVFNPTRKARLTSENNRTKFSV